MSVRATLIPLALLLFCSHDVFAQAAPQPAPAAATDDGYCDFVEGTASSTAATLYAPELFGQFGYIEQPAFAVTPGTDTSNLRAIGGIRWSLTNIIAGSATSSLAEADCRKHKALMKLRQITGAVHGAPSAPLAIAAARALAAKLRVYDEARAEAEKFLAGVSADLEAKRTTAPDAIALRLRVEDMRSSEGDIREQLAALPPELNPANGATDPRALESIISEYTSADAAMEKRAARLRTVRAYDLNVRAGVDQFLQGPSQATNYFAVVQLGINLGALFTSSGNSQSSRGRSQFARSEMAEQTLSLAPDAEAAQTTAAQLRAVLDVDTKRLQQVQALATDLDQQLKALDQIPGEESKRFRQTMWFDAIKAKADLAYLQAHVQALKELLGSK